MHELFTTAVVPSELVGEILKILQGLCAMTPTHNFERRLVFEGPKTPPLVGITGQQIQGRKQTNMLLWKELHDQLVRQSYYLTASYEIDEAQFRGSYLSEDVAMNGDELWVKPYFQTFIC
jgi:mediator of RNA polymerase II transcription subunit 18, fungi type